MISALGPEQNHWKPTNQLWVNSKCMDQNEIVAVSYVDYVSVLLSHLHPHKSNASIKWKLQTCRKMITNELGLSRSFLLCLIPICIYRYEGYNWSFFTISTRLDSTHSWTLFLLRHNFFPCSFRCDGIESAMLISKSHTKCIEFGLFFHLCSSVVLRNSWP